MVEKLYFVAHFNDGEPQHLVAGPFLNWPDAQEYIDIRESKALCIVSTELAFELEMEPSI